METKTTQEKSEACAGLAATTGSPAPSWEDFCARMKEVWPETLPDNRDEKWTNLYTVYEIGYGACLLHMQQLLEQENTRLTGGD